MSPQFRRTLLIAATAGYLVTWIFGVPAAHELITTSVTQIYAKRAAKVHPDFRREGPGFSFKAAVPVVRFIVAVRHDYVVGPLYTWGGVEFFLWFPWDVRSLGELTFWVS